MASTASDSLPPASAAPGPAFLADDDHQLFLDPAAATSSFLFPGATAHHEEPSLQPPAAASAASASRKPPRKRPRASRRPPTTVLTTDTSNFRAMVQEFTGIPAPPPFAPHHLVGGPGVGGALFGSRAPFELLMRPSPPTGSFAHSLFASGNANSNPAAAAPSSSSEVYASFAPSFSGTAAPSYGAGGFEAAEDERSVDHGHGLFSSFLHAGDRYHSH